MTLDRKSADELAFYTDTYDVRHSIADLTPTVCSLMGIPLPDQCGRAPISAVIDQAGHLMDGAGKAERVLVFAADALGDLQVRTYPDEFARVEKLAGFKIKCAGVMDSVTPVCFGTIFSGASPRVHGIQHYEKPVLKIQTLFDVLAAAGKRTAILSCVGCSIDLIFRERSIDYYSFGGNRPFDYVGDTHAFERTRKLIAENAYDFILCYMAGYDAAMHKTGIFSPESVAQLRLSVRRFEQLVADTQTHWKDKHRAVLYIADHGAHDVDATHGAHGTDLPEDMIVNHFYRVRGAGE